MKILNRMKTRIMQAVLVLPLKIKIFISISILSIILIVTLGSILYSKTSNIINHQVNQYSNIILEQVIKGVEDLKEETLNISIPIVTNEDIQNNDFANLDKAQLINRKKKIESELRTINLFEDHISSIYVCTSSGEIFSSNGYSTQDKKIVNEFEAYKKGTQTILSTVWMGIHSNEFSMVPDNYVLTFTRALYDKNQFKPFGALIINIPGELLSEICESEKNKDKYKIFIINKQGDIIYNSLGIIGSEPINRNYIGALFDTTTNEGEFNWEFNSSSYKVKYINPPESEWIYITEIPMDYLTNNSRQVRDFIVVILLISLLLSFFIAYTIASSLTEPFSRMIGTMKMVETGNFDIELDLKDKSEIGQLAASYVHMVHRIKDLIQRVHVENNQKREAELTVLQAQITPHFLYNTLNSIKCLASIQKAEGIELMTSNLIELLQLSISKKNDLITMKDELEILEKYLFIQNFRFGNRYNLEIECSEDLYRLYTLKMTLQPLVENAILHGFSSNITNCVIQIKIYRLENTIHIEVKDNGKGIEQETIEKIIGGNHKSENGFTGIGIKNTIDRINLHFDHCNGVLIESVPEEFTVIKITHPVIEEIEVNRYV